MANVDVRDGEELRLQRQTLQLTIAQVAKRCGRSPTWLAQLERGELRMTDYSRELVRYALECAWAEAGHEH